MHLIVYISIVPFNHKKGESDTVKLPQITSKQLIYKNIYGYDRLYSKLILSDTDWMNYILKAIFTVRKHGRFYVTFEFFGAQISVMKVRQKKRHHTYKFEYEFSAEIFQKNIIRYFTAQIVAWQNDSVFNAEHLILDFYNQVIKQHF